MHKNSTMQTTNLTTSMQISTLQKSLRREELKVLTINRKI